MDAEFDIFFSIFIGLLIGMVAGYIMFPTSTYVGPYSAKIKRKYYKSKKTGKCYRLIPDVYICPIKYSMNQK